MVKKRHFLLELSGKCVIITVISIPTIQTRVTAVGGSNEGAQIKATFDNVKLISLAKAPPLAGVMLLLLDD